MSIPSIDPTASAQAAATIAAGPMLTDPLSALDGGTSVDTYA